MAEIVASSVKSLRSKLSVRFAVFAAVLLFGYREEVAIAGPMEDAAAAYKRRDFAAAMSILRPLADKGNAEAQNDVGVMYLGSQGVPQDFKEAARWFSLSASQGNANGEASLGASYQSGRGVPQDFKLALSYLSLAAKGGVGAAQFGLGLMYATGQGTPVDTRRAYIWFSLAAEERGPLSAPAAITNRDIARRRLSKDELASAENMLVRCKISNYKDCG